ncbi:MAG: DEAD/DEAH box helicase [archaeon]|nr:DEAD/DEAH box helicase [archaeon]
MINTLDTPSSFDDYKIPFDILRAIYSSNFDKPTIVQHKSLNTLFSSKDLFLSSQTSAGKTTSYIIYTLSTIDLNKPKSLQALVLSATRDSAQLIEQQYKTLCKYSKIKIIAFVGGTSIREDIQNMSNGCQIVVGTPGRILDMLNKKIISVNELKVFIVDEIFELVNRGFTDSLKNISKALNSQCQKVVFNSNISLNENYSSVINYSSNLVEIKEDLRNANLILKHLQQFKISLKKEWKLETLLNLYKMMEISQIFLYCNDKKTAEYLNEELSKKDFICGILNEDQEKMIKYFKKGYLRIMIIHDGTPSKDFDNLHDALIVNYDMPETKEDYFNRISRVDSFGRKNIVINFALETDNKIFEEIQNEFGNGFKIEEINSNLSFIEE